MAERHMRRVLGDEAQAVRAARSVMKSYGRYYAEALWARGKRVDELRSQTIVDGVEQIIGAREQGRGMIYGLPHVGNWEVAAPVSVDVKVPVVAVAENLPNRRITDWFTKMRADFGIEVVLATGWHRGDEEVGGSPGGQQGRGPPCRPRPEASRGSGSSSSGRRPRSPRARPHSPSAPGLHCSRSRRITTGTTATGW